MALDTSNSDALISCLSWRPRHIANSMIPIHKPIESTILSQALMPSSIGPLDTLPTELLQMILNSLDFQSLSRFARVSHQAKAMVESLPSYHGMMTHASTALIALSQTKLITFHSAATMYAALLSDRCISCQKYAAFLFLPTCERCCHQCLCQERSLRIISLRMAGICFGLSPKELGQIPIMLSIPGRYTMRQEITTRRRVRLVSLKQAKELGIFFHGSQEATKRAGVLEKTRKLSLRQLHLAQWLADSLSDSEPRNSSTPAQYIDAPDDNFGGMASIGFPSLRPNAGLENGLWCFGCQINYDRYRRRELESERQLYNSGVDLLGFFSGMVYEARSRSGFLEHVRDCRGARDLLQNTEDGKNLRRSKWS